MWCVFLCEYSTNLEEIKIFLSNYGKIKKVSFFYFNRYIWTILTIIKGKGRFNNESVF